MSAPEEDTLRARIAAMAIIGDRLIEHDHSSIMVTLETTVALVLLALYRNPRVAAGMLNDGLVAGVESRLSLFASRQPEARS